MSGLYGHFDATDFIGNRAHQKRIGDAHEQNQVVLNRVLQGGGGIFIIGGNAGFGADGNVGFGAGGNAGPAGVNAGSAGVNAGSAGVNADPAGGNAGPAGVNAGSAGVNADPAGGNAGPAGVNAGPAGVNAGSAGGNAGPAGDVPNGAAGSKAGGYRIYNAVLGRWLNPFEYLTLLQFLLVTVLILGYATHNTKLKDVCPAIPEGEWTLAGYNPRPVNLRLLCESLLHPLFRFWPGSEEMKVRKALRWANRAVSREESLRDGYISPEFYKALPEKSIKTLTLEDLKKCSDDGELNFTCVNRTKHVEILHTPSGFRQMPKPGSPPRQVIDEFLQCIDGGIVSQLCIVRSKPIMQMVNLTLTNEEFAKRAAEKGYVLKNSADFDKAAEEAGYVLKNSTDFNKAAEEAGYFRNNTEHFKAAVKASGYVKIGTRAFHDAANESGFVRKDSQEFFDEVQICGYVKGDVLVYRNNQKTLAHFGVNILSGLAVAVISHRLYATSDVEAIINPRMMDVIVGTLFSWFYTNPGYGTVVFSAAIAVGKKFLDDYIDTWI